jgi:polyphosphate glucokinase
MNVLVIDIGGTHVKILATGQTELRKFSSGPTLTPKQMVAGVKKLARGWKYDVVSIGYPGMVVRNRLLAEPYNLGGGWMGFDFESAFKRPVKLINDAAMQALGSYKRGKMLFLGLGTGLGSTMIVDGIVEPMELAHLPYKKGTYEDYVGERSLEKRGKKKWRRYVADVVERLLVALEPSDVVLGGGNVTKLKELPKGTRAGNNDNAFLGGFRLWEKAVGERRSRRAKTRKAKKPKPKNSRLRVVTTSKNASRRRRVRGSAVERNQKREEKNSVPQNVKDAQGVA